MFRSSTIIRELALNLAKVIFMLKHSVKLRRHYYAVVWQHVVEWCVCVLYAVHSYSCFAKVMIIKIIS